MSGVGLRYQERPPGAALRRGIECVWMVWDPLPSQRRAPDHIVPDACPELIVHLADPFRRHAGGRWVSQPRAFLAGTLSRPWRVRAGLRVRTLGIRFRPGEAPGFLRVDMAQATDREIPLERLVEPGAAAELARVLGGAGGRKTAFDRAEQWLLARRAERPPDVTLDTRTAVAEILRTRGRERIEAVALRVGIPRRRLERAFARNLGIRPKLFARIVRLQAALAALARNQRTPAVDWALAAGYFDQAHLARDFRAVAGRRAGAARENDGELARHFTDPRRLAALLAGE